MSKKYIYLLAIISIIGLPFIVYATPMGKEWYLEYRHVNIDIPRWEESGGAPDVDLLKLSLDPQFTDLYSSGYYVSYIYTFNMIDDWKGRSLKFLNELHSLDQPVYLPYFYHYNSGEYTYSDGKFWVSEPPMPGEGPHPVFQVHFTCRRDDLEWITQKMVSDVGTPIRHLRMHLSYD